MALAKQIKCNGVEPTKSQVFILAAELVAKDNIYIYEEAIVQSLMSFDYYNYYNNNYYYYNYNKYNKYNKYNNKYNKYNNYNYYYNYNKEEKVLALLFLACIAETE